jgi:hypothetical protein
LVASLAGRGDGCVRAAVTGRSGPVGSHGQSRKMKMERGRSVGPVDGVLGRAGLSCEAFFSPSLFSFLFFISFPSFEFKFGLKFKFQTDVTYSLVFREFCLAILYINIGVVCYIYIELVFLLYNYPSICIEIILWCVS